jgi:drug/metabolite transporter (DMT)-like permease
MACALASALLWGGSVPFSKQIADAGAPPLEGAALLYGGAGLGLGAWLALARLGGPAPAPAARPVRRDVTWLLATTVVGAVLAPVLLVHGLAHASGLAAALLLAVEPSATALIAVAVFGERATPRLGLGVALVTAGAVLVGLRPDAGPAATTTVAGALAVAGAACAWGLDNNLTTRIAHLDPRWVVMMKGLVGAGLALGLSAALTGRPIWAGHWSAGALAQMLAAGFVGYGLGMALIVRAFRELGAARTGAIFASAPLFGALFTIPVLGERPTPALVGAAALLAAGVACIVREGRPGPENDDAPSDAGRGAP